MAVSGLPEYEVGHAKHISLLALDMMDLSQTVTVDGEPVVRIILDLFIEQNTPKYLFIT